MIIGVNNFAGQSIFSFNAYYARSGMQPMTNGRHLSSQDYASIVRTQW